MQNFMLFKRLFVIFQELKTCPIFCTLFKDDENISSKFYFHQNYYYLLLF